MIFQLAIELLIWKKSERDYRGVVVVNKVQEYSLNFALTFALNFAFSTVLMYIGERLQTFFEADI